MTCLVEIKTSRADFLRDDKWECESPADLSYVAMPSGIASIQECPATWGKIVLSENCDRVIKTHAPIPRQSSVSGQSDFMASLLMRLHNDIHYAREREFQREQRLGEGINKTISRMSNLVNAFLAIADGKPVDEAMKYHIAYHDKIPEHVMQRIREYAVRLKPPGA
jgi:hypothetical protein